MIKSDIINKTNYSTLISDFIKFSSKELGDVKVREIIDKINKSDKVRKFLYEVNSTKSTLVSDDFIFCIQSNINFTFAKAETISIATILLLEKWNSHVNIPNQLADSDYIRDIFFRILDKCDGYKLHLDSTENFFGRFYTFLEKGLNKVVEDKNDPNYWVILAMDAVSFYSIGFDKSRPVWYDFTFNTFILNCSYIYSIKFPEELNQIGWDHYNPNKNLFNELVLKTALNFFDKKTRATKMPIKEEIFENEDDVDACLKDFAIAITKLRRTPNKDYMRMITYNVYNSLIVKEFHHKQNSNDLQMTDLASKLGEAVNFLGNKLI